MKIEKIVFSITSVLSTILLVMAIRNENFKMIFPLVLLLISQLGMLFFNKSKE